MITWILFTNMGGAIVYKHMSGEGMRWFETGSRGIDEVDMGVNGVGCWWGEWER